MILAKVVKVFSTQPLNADQIRFVELMIDFMFLSGMLIVLSAVLSVTKKGR